MGFFSDILESFSKNREAFETETDHMDAYRLCQELKRIDSFALNKISVYQNALANKICEISDAQLLDLCRENKQYGNTNALRVLGKEAINRNLAYKDENGIHFYR